MANPNLNFTRFAVKFRFKPRKLCSELPPFRWVVSGRDEKFLGPVRHQVAVWCAKLRTPKLRMDQEVGSVFFWFFLIKIMVMVVRYISGLMVNCIRFFWDFSVDNSNFTDVFFWWNVRLEMLTHLRVPTAYERKWQTTTWHPGCNDFIDERHDQQKVEVECFVWELHLTGSCVFFFSLHCPMITNQPGGNCMTAKKVDTYNHWKKQKRIPPYNKTNELNSPYLQTSVVGPVRSIG